MNPEINTALRTHQVERSEVLATLHYYLSRIVKRFFGDLPLPALSLEPGRFGVLGSYCNQDGLALSHRININLLHTDRPLAEVLRTIAHELGHLWQAVYGKPAKPPYHNKEFQQKMLEIGIPCTAKGHSLEISEPFISFLKDLGVETKLFPFKQEIQTPPKKTRTCLAPWFCSCTKVWVSAGVVLKAVCAKCFYPFVPIKPEILSDEREREFEKFITDFINTVKGSQ
jgi:hypothetical protein